MDRLEPAGPPVLVDDVVTTGATLTAADLGAAGTLSVSVRNPDGSISDAATLTISSQGPLPPSGHRRAARH